MTISDAVEFDYCPNGGLAEVEVSVVTRTVNGTGPVLTVRVSRLHRAEM